MDQNIGRMLDYLKRPGRPLQFFRNRQRRRRLIGYTTWRAPAVDPRDMDNSIAHIGKVGSYAEYGPGYGLVDSTPFMFKSFMYRGGIAVPAIAWGRASQGRQARSAMARVTDIAPTLVELAGANTPAPSTRAGRAAAAQPRRCYQGCRGAGRPCMARTRRSAGELGGRKAAPGATGRSCQRTNPGAAGDWGSSTSPGTAARPATSPPPPPEAGRDAGGLARLRARETGTLEIPNLANRPATATARSTTRDLKLQATLVPRTARP